MRISTFFLLLLLIGALVAAGYFYQQDQYAQEKARLLEEWNGELKFQFERLQAENASLSARLEAEISKISTEKEQEIERLNQTHEKLIDELKGEIEQKEIKITQLADRLEVRLTDKILFPSGEAALTPEGLKILERVGNIIKKEDDKIIRVEGHTDNVPIHPRLQKQFASNWELSTARATNVVRFFQEKINIPPERLEAIGLAEYHPVASNKSKAGRGKNRRIEIILVPLNPLQQAGTG